jgi:hypothetical protein
MNSETIFISTSTEELLPLALVCYQCKRIIPEGRTMYGVTGKNAIYCSEYCLKQDNPQCES